MAFDLVGFGGTLDLAGYICNVYTILTQQVSSSCVRVCVRNGDAAHIDRAVGRSKVAMHNEHICAHSSYPNWTLTLRRREHVGRWTYVQGLFAVVVPIACHVDTSFLVPIL